MIPLLYSDLYAAIPKSRNKATNIRDLAALLGHDEREVRDCIKDLREIYHKPVVCLPTRNGVWVAQTPEEVDLEIACQTSRARSIERSVQVLIQVQAAMAYTGKLC